MYPKTVEMREKRDQIPKCDLSLFEKRDSEEEEKEGWGKERKEDKGTSESMSSVVI